MDQHCFVARGRHSGCLVFGARGSTRVLLCRRHTGNLAVLACSARLPHRIFADPGRPGRQHPSAPQTPVFLADRPADVQLPFRLVFLEWTYDVANL